MGRVRVWQAQRQAQAQRQLRGAKRRGRVAAKNDVFFTALVRTNPSGAAHEGSWFFVVRSQPPVIVSVSAAGRAHGTHVRTRAGRAHLNEARMRTSRREPVALAA